MTMRMLIVGGGTGGHIFPAIAIAQRLRARLPDAEIHFAGMATGMEARVVASEGYPFHAMPAARLKGMGWLRRVQSCWTVLQAIAAARRILRALQPDCVIGTGGYVSGPLVLTAALSNIPTVIHEQNSVPGLTNRLLARVVKKICTTFAESARYFPARKVVDTGMPIRANVVEALRGNPAPAAEPQVLLIMGGSQGARRINELVVDMLPQLQSVAGHVRVIHQVGRSADCVKISAAYQQANISAEVLPFIEQMESIYPQVHLAISRSGAGSLAELALAGIPAILVPFPAAADNHQEINAREVVANGGALLMREQDASAERLATQVTRLLRDVPRLQSMRAAMHDLARPDAADNVVNVCVGATHV